MQEAPFSERIYEAFCTDCKYKKKASRAGCPMFVSAECVCVRFEWCSKEREKEHQQEVLDNWATTIWLERGKRLSEIWEMPQEELRKVLSKKHYEYFEKRKKEDKELLDQKLAEAAVEKQFKGQEVPKNPKQLQKLKEKKEQLVKEELAKRKKQLTTKEVLEKWSEAVADDKKDVETVVLETAKNSTVLGQFVKHITATEPVTAAKTATITFNKAKIFPSLTPPSTQAATVAGATHYFNCQKPDGSMVTYKRSTQSKSYQSEIVAFRKYLAKQNIAILTEEIK
ncbi:MAG: hypothetical protein NC218_01665 [Acetobacter sp.]|nr:hypothetical protein [Acetobacter sp.]